MTPDLYQQLARRTQADQGKILQRLLLLGPEAMRLDNAARGLAGDAGEVSSAVMKFIEYGRELDGVNLLEEVGDCLWRLGQLCDAAQELLGRPFTLDLAMAANIAKLEKRYPDKYSDHLAAEENRDRGREAEAVRSSWTGPAADAAEKMVKRRTKDEVLTARHSPHTGCCERYANNMACDCLAEAE